MGVGGSIAWNQHRKIATYRPVEAVVLSKTVESHRGNKSTTYTPIVEYRYTVDGQSYTARRVLPVNLSSGYGWATSVIAPFSVGQTTRAYHDPNNPAEAFLLRQYSFFPYIFILFPMVFVALLMGAVIGGGASLRAPPEPIVQPDGWFELQPTSLVAQRQRAVRSLAAAWFAVGAVAAGHYFVAAAPKYGTEAVVATSIYVVLGGVPLGLAVYYARLRRSVDDARLTVNTPQFRRGVEFKARADQMIHQDLHIQELSLGLACDEVTQTRSGGKTTISTRTCYTDRLPVIPEAHERAGNNLTAVATLRIPPDQPLSSPANEKGYPRYCWRIEVATRIANGPDYRAKFPIRVT